MCPDGLKLTGFDMAGISCSWLCAVVSAKAGPGRNQHGWTQLGSARLCWNAPEVHDSVGLGSTCMGWPGTIMLIALDWAWLQKADHVLH